jgi:hypothetical protein
MEHSPARLLGPVRLEAIALVAGGTLVVHNGRFAAADGAKWQDAIAETGHSYLSFLLPLVAVALGAAIWLLARDAVRGPSTAALPRPSFARTWAAVTVVLIAVYCGQELAEGLLSAQHQTGLSGVAAEGGWSAFLLAPLVGALIAALLCGARAAVALMARVAPELSIPLPASPTVAVLAAPAAAPVDVLASNLAGRGPPVTG